MLWGLTVTVWWLTLDWKVWLSCGWQCCSIDAWLSCEALWLSYSCDFRSCDCIVHVTVDWLTHDCPVKLCDCRVTADRVTVYSACDCACVICCVCCWLTVCDCWLTDAWLSCKAVWLPCDRRSCCCSACVNIVWLAFMTVEWLPYECCVTAIIWLTYYCRTWLSCTYNCRVTCCFHSYNQMIQYVYSCMLIAIQWIITLCTDASLF